MIIVTGATGQLGSAIVKKLIEHVPAAATTSSATSATMLCSRCLPQLGTRKRRIRRKTQLWLHGLRP